MGWDVWVGKICTFLSSVSSQQKFEAMDGPVLQPLDGPVLQPHVTVQFYLESRGKYILEACGWANPKDPKRSPQPNFGPTFYMFFFSSPCCCCCCWVASVVSYSVQPHRWQPTRLPVPGILQARTLEVHWTHSSGLPFPAAEWVASVVSDSVRPHRRQPTRLPVPGLPFPSPMHESEKWKWSPSVVSDS